MPASTRNPVIHASTTLVVQTSPAFVLRREWTPVVVATPDKHHTSDEASSFNPTGGPRRSKFGPLVLTLGVLLLVLLIFAAIGWLRYNTG